MATSKANQYSMSRSGMKVITTSSPKNFQLLRDRGADLVYDYVSRFSNHTLGLFSALLTQANCSALRMSAS